MIYNNPIVSMLPRSYHLLLSAQTQNVPITISLLSLYNFFIFLMSSKSRLIAVSEKTYHDLAQMGTLEDSFNSVIERMIQKQKAAMSGQSLVGVGQSTAAGLQSTDPKGVVESSSV
jgi:hypothetical protein